MTIEINFINIAIFTFTLGIAFFLGKNRRSSSARQPQDEVNPPFEEKQAPLHVREEKIRTGSSTIRSIMLKLAKTIHQVGEAADTSSSNLQEARTGVSAINVTGQVKEAQKILLGEIDRVISSNVELRSELDLAQKSIDEQKQEIETLRHAAHMDHLTQIANRSFFDETLDQSFEYFRRYQDIFSLIMIDIDHFKNINDTWGHPAGDQILARVAQKIHETIRVTDFVARYGGEEFAVILIKSDLSGACSVAEELRKVIEVNEFSSRGTKIPVTISLGVTAVNENDNPESLLKRADQALYQAKNEGRNRYARAE